MILVTDPQASGVIGYGPSVANPNTGEILNARTVMYYGTIQKFVSRAYDELVEEVVRNAQAGETNKAMSTTNEKAQAYSSSTGFADHLTANLDLSQFDADDFIFGSNHNSHVPFQVNEEDQIEMIEKSVERR